MFYFDPKPLKLNNKSSFPNKKVQYLFARALGDKKEWKINNKQHKNEKFLC